MGEATRLPSGRASEFPYKLLTIRITPSFCEGIRFVPRLEQSRLAPSALKATLFCSMKAPLAQIRPASRSQARLSEAGRRGHKVAGWANSRLIFKFRSAPCRAAMLEKVKRLFGELHGGSKHSGHFD